ncbi:hypothetical protein MPSEU_000918800 [Mayamaea pseudoterrestris]|nr:hypothetical protein MPSEU_000918800 [Mayamaea pseudoterrestris]
MASLSLPPPRNVVPTVTKNLDEGNDAIAPNKQKKEPHQQQQQQPQLPAAAPRAPSYEERCSAAAHMATLTPEERKRTKLFVPRSLADFDDGGAFPEIHMAQYPRHMGNPHLRKQQAASSGVIGAQATSTAIVNVQVDKTGQVSFDSIIKGGTNSDKLVYTKLQDMKGGKAKADDIALPTEEEQAAEAARTQAAVSAIINKKTAMQKPSGSALAHVDSSRDIESKTQFIKYTPRPDAPGYNPAAAQRVIQMVPAQVDPMMPPKHKHIKAPPGPAEDPVPVLHAPNKKLTKEEKASWNVPACISNWKNARGYTIPLDKRLAADGRGLRDFSINEHFATLSESLYEAERAARTEVRLRAQVQQKMAMQEKVQREEELRQLANQARMERGGAVVPGVSAGRRDESEDDDDDDRSNHGKDIVRESEDDVAARQRERLRMERKREREKEMRMDKNIELKKKKLEEERDVSEKIALGVHTGTGGLGGDVDSRLYNQTSGMDSGFGGEDEYNTYTKPLFGDQQAASTIYRPTRGETDYNADEQYDKLVEGATNKFQPDKGFAGAEGGTGVRGAGPRTAPVQFEKKT